MPSKVLLPEMVILVRCGLVAPSLHRGRLRVTSSPVICQRVVSTARHVEVVKGKGNHRESRPPPLNRKWFVHRRLRGICQDKVNTDSCKCKNQACRLRSSMKNWGHHGVMGWKKSEQPYASNSQAADIVVYIYYS